MNTSLSVRPTKLRRVQSLVHRISPIDLERERRFIQRLAPATKRQRFLGAVGEPSDAQLLRLVSPRSGSELALAWMVGEEFAAVARYAVLGVSSSALSPEHEPTVREAQGPRAEFAIVVADQYQGQGIGRKLSLALIEAARQAGIATLVGDCYAENRAVIALVESLGFTVSRHLEDAGLCSVHLSLANHPSSVGLPLERSNALHHARYQ